MISLSERASQAIQDMRVRFEIGDERGVRIAPDESGGLAMTFDRPHASDVVLRDHQKPALILDGAIVDRLATTVLDYADGDSEHAAHFLLRRRIRRRRPHDGAASHP